MTIYLSIPSYKSGNLLDNDRSCHYETTVIISCFFLFFSFNYCCKHCILGIISSNVDEQLLHIRTFHYCALNFVQTLCYYPRTYLDSFLINRILIVHFSVTRPYCNFSTCCHFGWAFHVIVGKLIESADTCASLFEPSTYCYHAYSCTYFYVPLLCVFDVIMSASAGMCVRTTYATQK